MSTKQQLPLDQRLKNGSRILGILWREATERCKAGWSLEVCACQPQKKFCTARVQWLTLAVEDGRFLEDHPFGMALAMKASEWDATGLGLRIDHPNIGEFKSGTGPDCVTSMGDLVKLLDTPDFLESTLRVMKTFPKSHVQGVEEPPAAPVEEELFE